MWKNSNMVITFWFASFLFSQDVFEGYTLFTPGGGGGGGSATTYLKDNSFNNITLSDFEGKKVVLFFYPLDFTFV